MPDPDPGQLPHLLKLLTDDSPAVQQALREAFAAFGPGLSAALEALEPPATEAERLQIRALLEEQGRQTLRERWGEWLSLPGEEEQLEAALSMLAEFLGGPWQTAALGDGLDTLAKEFLEAYEERTPVTLAHFLFKDKGFHGAAEDYDDPSHSNLVFVLRERRGLPISLVLVYKLVGFRAGIPVETCNFPRHFLARVTVDEETFFVDCFHGGTFYREAELFSLMPAAAGEFKEVLRVNPDPEMILKRVLNNLIAAYETRAQHDNSQLMVELLQSMEDPPEL